MKKIDEILNGVSCMAIAGHVRPDGDCIGSCLGLYPVSYTHLHMER